MRDVQRLSCLYLGNGDLQIVDINVVTIRPSVTTCKPQPVQFFARIASCRQIPSKGAEVITGSAVDALGDHLYLPPNATTTGLFQWLRFNTKRSLLQRYVGFFRGAHIGAAGIDNLLVELIQSSFVKVQQAGTM